MVREQYSTFRDPGGRKLVLFVLSSLISRCLSSWKVASPSAAIAALSSVVAGSFDRFKTHQFEHLQLASKRLFGTIAAPQRVGKGPLLPINFFTKKNYHVFAGNPLHFHLKSQQNFESPTSPQRGVFVKNPVLPHSVVQHAQSTSVREFIQKIENHPNRHALQQDLRQNQSFNPFSPESKQMIRDVGNIELCELLETEPKT